MAASKRSSFPARENTLADFARGLSHPARIAILEFLARRDACMCGDIVDEIPLSQSTVSQHLEMLKRVGLIRGEIDGPRVCYCIDPARWKEARRLLTEFFADHPAAERRC